MNAVATVFYEVLIITYSHSEAFYFQGFCGILVNTKTLHFKIVLAKSKRSRLAILNSCNIKVRIGHNYKTELKVTGQLLDYIFQFWRWFITPFLHIPVHSKIKFGINTIHGISFDNLGFIQRIKINISQH